MGTDETESTRPEILALSSNADKTMVVNGVEIKKGTVARLAHCINFLESPDNLTSKEHEIIDNAVNECLEAFYQMSWHLYYDFKQPYIQKKYDSIRKKHSSTD
jgi:hypothetical protein